MAKSGVVHNNCVYFFGSDPDKYVPDCAYYVFSQWHKCSFVDDSNEEYSSAEQYMMAEKARLFDDSEALEEILDCEDPKKIKELGRKVKDFDEEVWAAKRLEIVFTGNKLKFSQNEDLKKVLLETGDMDIAEAAPKDKIWGIGMSVQQATQTTSKDDWKGQNLLGQALIKVRDELVSTDSGNSPDQDVKDTAQLKDADDDQEMEKDGDEDEAEEEPEEEEAEEKVEKPRRGRPRKKRQAEAVAESGSSKRSRKPRKKKDKDAPKRGLSAFLFYSKEHRERIRSENPSLAFGEVGKMLGDMWRKLPSDEKAKFTDMAEKDKVRYKEELELYNKERQEKGSE